MGDAVIASPPRGDHHLFNAEALPWLRIPTIAAGYSGLSRALRGSFPITRP
jgi:hypothetical protein